MKTMIRIGFMALFAVALLALPALALETILQPGDPIIPIDLDPPAPPGSTSSSPDAEQAPNILDNDSATKYLNFGEVNSGFIVTPAFGASTVQSFLLTTANDAVERDPSAWALFGTNDPISSTDHSLGDAENWTLIDEGPVNLPDERFADGPIVDVTNATLYDSYRMIFTGVKDEAAANSMQIADVFFYDGPGGTGNSLLGIGDPILAIDTDFTTIPESSSPGAEQAPNAIDGDDQTKYLNFGEENSGFIVTPSAGSSIVEGFQITTANDAEERDPAAWELYGTNDPITSGEHSQGNEENWTLMGSGTIDMPTFRFEPGPLTSTDANGTDDPDAYVYKSYRMVFPQVRDEAAANSMQIAEVQFYGQLVADVTVLGDVNLDGQVNGLDVDPFVDVLLNGPYQTEADMNEDGVVNGLDVDTFVAAVVGGGAQAVPEPSTLALAALGLLALVSAGWQRRSNR